MSGAVWSVSAALFHIGLAGVALRRQLLAMFLGMELVLFLRYDFRAIDLWSPSA